MKKIYSKKEPLMLLHIINQKRDINEKRQKLSTPNQYLQVSCKRMELAEEITAHKHSVYSKITTITQESLVVISGAVAVTLYDIDDTILEEVVLSPGDCSITYLGGHSYRCLKNKTIVYCFETGPQFKEVNEYISIQEKNKND